VPLDPQQIIDLTDAALSADYTKVRRVANTLARALADQGEDAAARAIRAMVRKRGVPLRASGYVESLPVDMKSRLPLVEEHAWPSTPIFLNEQNAGIFRDFIFDVQHVDAMAAKGLSTRLGMILSGPPGTGKSLLAGHIAQQLDRPFYVVRLDAVISSLLGDTAKNIRAVFDFVPMKDAVLFLDEMDAIAKLRDDRHELGELKRVVNTVIQSLDALDQHAVVVAATNHAHLLDPAIWRRFPYKIELGNPDEKVRTGLWEHFLFEEKDEDGLSPILAQISDGLSGADIENIALAARRHSLIGDKELDLGPVALSVTDSVLGKRSIPQKDPLTPDQKRDLAFALSERNVSVANIGRLIGVTRQAIYLYLKSPADGGNDG